MIKWAKEVIMMAENKLAEKANIISEEIAKNVLHV